MRANTLFLRLEGMLQAWGSPTSKFGIRRTFFMPTKSAIAGIICSALGVPREDCADEWLPKIADMKMGVRIDRAGLRMWDYHTVGAKQKMMIAEYSQNIENAATHPPTAEEAMKHSKKKYGALLSRREYLSDASFLVALQGEPGTVEQMYNALKNPKWQLFLGRKCCPTALPIAGDKPRYFDDLISALSSIPLSLSHEQEAGEKIEIYLDWQADNIEDLLPENVQIINDVATSFSPNIYRPRYVEKTSIPAEGLEVLPDYSERWRPHRPRANYTNTEYRRVRAQRLVVDYGLCVFCKSPATTVQHISYEHAGGGEKIDELRSLCRLCHDAATMLEYGAQMGMYRIDPSDIKWREQLLAKREEIVKFRSKQKNSRMMKRQSEEE